MGVTHGEEFARFRDENVRKSVLARTKRRVLESDGRMGA